MTHLCLSGGAIGADLTWGDAAEKAGHAVVHWTFFKHKSLAPARTLHMLTTDDLCDADPRLEQANLTLQRRWPIESGYVTNLLRRNWYQVGESDGCYAVAALDSSGKVKGGTAWAVQMFIDRFDGAPCRCFLFCQTRGYWMRWERQWERCTPPPPRGVYAGVGSRKLMPNGRDAIYALF